jgi:hypothetical protein
MMTTLQLESSDHDMTMVSVRRKSSYRGAKRLIILSILLYLLQ